MAEEQELEVRIKAAVDKESFRAGEREIRRATKAAAMLERGEMPTDRADVELAERFGVAPGGLERFDKHQEMLAAQEKADARAKAKQQTRQRLAGGAASLMGLTPVVDPISLGLQTANILLTGIKNEVTEINRKTLDARQVGATGAEMDSIMSALGRVGIRREEAARMAPHIVRRAQDLGMTAQEYLDQVVPNIMRAREGRPRREAAIEFLGDPSGQMITGVPQVGEGGRPSDVTAREETFGNMVEAIGHAVAGALSASFQDISTIGPFAGSPLNVHRNFWMEMGAEWQERFPNGINPQNGPVGP